MKLPYRTELHGWSDELQVAEGATSADHRSASTLTAVLLKNDGDSKLIRSFVDAANVTWGEG